MVILAVDGLDWGLVQRLVDAGVMPYVGQMLEAGASGAMRVPAPVGAAAQWTTVSTGVLADEHGVLCDQMVQADGLRISQVDGSVRRSATIWETAAASGWTSQVACWPAAGPAKGDTGREGRQPPPNLTVVSEGFERADYASPLCWPLSPEAVSPPAWRELVDQARVHPDDLDIELAVPMLAQPRFGEGDPLLRPARWLLARWLSVHNLGVHWASGLERGLAALRWAGLPEWMALLRQFVPEQTLEAGMTPWYRYLDMFIGRYMAVVGRNAYLVLVSNTGVPAAPMGEGELFLAGGTGGLAIAGPGVPADTLWENISGLDVVPTLSGLLGLECPSTLMGRNLLDAKRRPLDARNGSPSTPNRLVTLDDLLRPAENDVQAQQWVQDHGCMSVDIGALSLTTRPVQAQTLLAWAMVRRMRGELSDAMAALRELLRLTPQHLPAKVLLGELLLETGQASECEALATELPQAAKEGMWADVVEALIGFGAQDWPRAERHLQRLVAAGHAPLNAPAWLGWARVQQKDWPEAERWFRVATAWPGEQVRIHEGLGVALSGLCRHAEAVQAFSLAIAEQPANARLHLLRAMAYEACGDLGRAEVGHWRALTLDGSLTRGFERLAHVLRSRDSQRTTSEQPLPNC